MHTVWSGGSAYRDKAYEKDIRQAAFGSVRASAGHSRGKGADEMTFLTWLAAFAAGLLASMGVGGGMILIIWLTAVMGMSQIDAQGVNLIYFLPIAALSVFIHRKNGLIDLKAMLPAIIAGTVGACLGAYGARLIDTGLLGKIFSVFVIFIGIKELWGAVRNK